MALQTCPICDSSELDGGRSSAVTAVRVTEAARRTTVCADLESTVTAVVTGKEIA